MKIYSNTPIPTTPERWKEGQYVIYINHIDNGIQPPDEAGMSNEGNRYQADFTILDSLTADEAIFAFSRQLNEPELNNKVIDSIEVDGKSAITVKNKYVTKVNPSIFPVLPSSGYLHKGEIYSYNNGAIMVEQGHTRTKYSPDDTPALFTFYRIVTEGQLWISNEKVTVNATRTYLGNTYKCIQAHTTVNGLTPDITPALWNVIPALSEWQSGISYEVNDLVTYLGFTYKVLQAHTSQARWTPPIVTALFIKT